MGEIEGIHMVGDIAGTIQGKSRVNKIHCKHLAQTSFYKDDNVEYIEKFNLETCFHTSLRCLPCIQ